MNKNAIDSIDSECCYKPVPIPDEQFFLKQWYQWTHMRVARLFKRDKSRIADSVQRVRCRLLQKEFTARWFFKHLKEELVDKTQAERILGGAPITFIGTLKPVVGHRTESTSLWRVSDLLHFARFNHERYFYSIQNHTIDSDHMLQLLAYEPHEYHKLQSLWRQGRILPAELTEHECYRRNHVGMSPKECNECKRGLASLRARGITLATDWQNADLIPTLKRMRWNDSQLQGFLRRWRKTNMVFSTPQYIMRLAPINGQPPGIDAGLLAYVSRIINNETINDFKRLSRTDDMSRTSYGSESISDNSEVSNHDVINDNEYVSNIPGDKDSAASYMNVECQRDIASLIASAQLNNEERDALLAVDLMEVTVRQYAKTVGIEPHVINKIRNIALEKLKIAHIDITIESVVDAVCQRYSCSRADLFGIRAFGSCVLARTDLFSRLHLMGISEDMMSSYFNYPRDKIVAARLRATRLNINPVSI
jgi:DNA-directed RNA polymerase specialized sigma24 family protein